ncbi:MAG TPA: hypothetical protein VFF87_09920 [Hyphomicrobium sp.]|nr:hypothetical protein [Hyphomicrobium sp.]
MSTTTTTPASVEGTAVVLRPPTLQWALKRALLGLVILFVTVATAAMLLHASIDPDEDTQSSFSEPHSGATTTQAARRL